MVSARFLIRGFFILGYAGLVLLAAIPVFAGTGQALEDVLEGFDAGEKKAPDEAPAPAGPAYFKSSPISVDGYGKLAATYNFAHDPPRSNQTDWRGLSRLRAELQVDCNLRFSDRWKGKVSGKGTYDFAYNLQGRDQFSAQVIDNYEKELELRETYLLGSIIANLDVKFGRQIVVWGKADNIRITDILNPLDLREPGLTDIEDLRLPVTMTRLDYYSGDWSITGVAVHEIRFNKMPLFGSDFFPGTVPPPFEEVPHHGAENTEYALAANGTFSAWDIALYAARLYNDLAHKELKTGLFGPQVVLSHARLKMLGGALNIAKGNWLFKAEAAFLDGFRFFSTADKTFARLDAGGGIEYSGFSDTTLSIEAVNRQILAYQTLLSRFPDETKERAIQTVMRVSRDFLNETLTLTYLLSLFGATGQDGLIQRFTLDYDITDALKLIGGAVFYESGDLAAYRNIGDNDRLYVEIKYSF